MALNKAAAQGNDPDPDQRSEQSRKAQSHSSQQKRVTGSGAVERDSGVVDDADVECGQSKTENASQIKAKRTNGDELDRSQDDAVASWHGDSFQRRVGTHEAEPSERKALQSQGFIWLWGYGTFLARVEERIGRAVYVHRGR